MLYSQIDQEYYSITIAVLELCKTLTMTPQTTIAEKIDLAT